MNVIELWLEELSIIENDFAYLLKKDSFSFNKFNDIKETILSLINLSDEEIFEICSDKFTELRNFLFERSHRQNEWVEIKNLENATDYIYTDDLANLKATLKSAGKIIEKCFKERLDTIRNNFKIVFDKSKFELMNNHLSNTKDECDKILRENNIDGLVWEVKCNSSILAYRFIAIQDNTNKRWFILSDGYAHKNNAANSQHNIAIKATKTYCKKLNNLELISKDIFENLSADDEIELEILAEQLIELFELNK